MKLGVGKHLVLWSVLWALLLPPLASATGPQVVAAQEVPLTALLPATAPSGVSASGGGSGWGVVIGFVIVGAVLELLIPDTHLELYDQGTNNPCTALSWPLPISVFIARFGNNDKFFGQLILHPEVQYQVENDLVRFVGTVRWLLSYEGVYIMGEAGGVLAEDGDSGLFGGGLGYSFEGYASAGIHYRRVFTGAARHDITFDVMVPIPVFSILAE